MAFKRLSAHREMYPGVEWTTIAAVAEPYVWAGQECLIALAAAANLVIYVHECDHAPVKFIHYDASKPSPTPVHLGFMYNAEHTSGHYVSLRRLGDKTAKPAHISLTDTQLGNVNEVSTPLDVLEEEEPTLRPSIGKPTCSTCNMDKSDPMLLCSNCKRYFHRGKTCSGRIRMPSAKQMEKWKCQECDLV
jgi:hypothetical protein